MLHEIEIQKEIPAEFLQEARERGVSVGIAKINLATYFCIPFRRNGKIESVWLPMSGKMTAAAEFVASRTGKGEMADMILASARKWTRRMKFHPDFLGMIENGHLSDPDWIFWDGIGALTDGWDTELDPDLFARIETGKDFTNRIFNLKLSALAKITRLNPQKSQSLLVLVRFLDRASTQLGSLSSRQLEVLTAILDAAPKLIENPTRPEWQKATEVMQEI